MKTTLCILCALLSHAAWALEDVSLRLYPSFYDQVSKTVYVDLEIRYDGQGEFRLADQNIRLFYNSDQLHLDKDFSRSDLPQDLYSDIHWHEVMEDLSADHVNQLSFDDELGFVNFSIDLEQDNKGGIVLPKNQSWHRIAVLSFEVEDVAALSQIVWSAPEQTDQYATAFVEVMEWTGPNQTRHTDISTYVDALFNAEKDPVAVDMTIAPNPAVDMISVTYQTALPAASDIRIIDVSGAVVKHFREKAGVVKSDIDVSGLMAGSYLIEVKELLTDKVLSTEQLIKVEG